MILGSNADNADKSAERGYFIGSEYIFDVGTNIFTKSKLEVVPFSEFECVVNVENIVTGQSIRYINDDW